MTQWAFHLTGTVVVAGVGVRGPRQVVLPAFPPGRVQRTLGYSKKKMGFHTGAEEALGDMSAADRKAVQKLIAGWGGYI